MISETTTKSQRDKILEILRAAGEQGVTNFELNRACCLRYGARIYELRKLGHNIKTVRVRGEQEFRFVLSSPQPEGSAPVKRSEGSVARGAEPDVFEEARRKFFEPQLPLFEKAVRA